MNLETKKIATEYDIQIINLWFKEWGMSEIPYDSIPENCYLVLDNGKPICAGSIYLSDSKTSFIQNLVCDPDSDKDLRDIALDFLVTTLFQKARKRGYKYWNACTKNDHIIDRAKKFNLNFNSDNCFWIAGNL